MPSLQELVSLSLPPLSPAPCSALWYSPSKGAGTGAAVARRFAKQYPVALLARSPDFSRNLAAEIEAEGGTAVSYKVDVADEEDMARVFGEITQRFGTTCAAAIFNASSRPFPKPFLWQTQGDVDHALNITLWASLLPTRCRETLTRFC